MWIVKDHVSLSFTFKKNTMKIFLSVCHSPIAIGLIILLTLGFVRFTMVYVFKNLSKLERDKDNLC